MNSSLSKSHGVEFVITFKQSFAIGTVVKTTRIEKKKVQIGSMMTQFV